MDLPRINNNHGQILAGVLIFLMVGLAAGVTISTFTANRTIVGTKDLREKVTQNLAEAGIAYAITQLNASSTWNGENEKIFGQGSFDIQLANNEANSNFITSTGYIPSKTNYTAKSSIRIQANLGEGIALRYAVQAGDGGVQLDNNSMIKGNLYSNGDVIGNSGAQATGTVIVAGTKKISGITVGEDAYAYRLENCTINGSAYYNTISNCAVTGQQTPNSEELPPGEFPIIESQIDGWKNDAAAGGSQLGISLSGSQTLSAGPKKINGNVLLQNSSVLTVTGTLHITGTLTIKNDAILKLFSSYGSLNGIIIVDGKVAIQNNAQAQGSETQGSTILIISMASTLTDDIDLKNNADTGLFFAPYGEIAIENNVKLESATAYKLHLKNNAQVVYNTGIVNQNFSSGPSASWGIQPGTWHIIK